MAKGKKEAAPKRSNIYKVVTTIEQPGGNEHQPIERIDFVRAKTKQGARNFVAGLFIKAEVASQDDLLSLAGKVKLLEEKAE